MSNLLSNEILASLIAMLESPMVVKHEKLDPPPKGWTYAEIFSLCDCVYEEEEKTFYIRVPQLLDTEDCLKAAITGYETIEVTAPILLLICIKADIRENMDIINWAMAGLRVLLGKDVHNNPEQLKYLIGEEKVDEALEFVICEVDKHFHLVDWWKGYEHNKRLVMDEKIIRVEAMFK